MLKKDYSKKKYYSPLQESKNKKKGPKRGRLIVANVVAFFALVGIAYAILVSPWLKVERIQIKGTNDPNINTLVGKWLTTQSEQKIWKLIPKDNLLVINLDELNVGLTNDKYVKSVELDTTFPDTITVNIYSRRPVLLYTLLDKNFLIDQDGLTIEQVPIEKKHLTQVPNVLGTTTNTVIQTTNPELDANMVKFIESLNNEFPKYVNTINLTRYNIFPGNYEVKAITNSSWYILFDSQIDLNIQLSNLSRALREIIPENELDNLQYIDVRLENYIYYK